MTPLLQPSKKAVSFCSKSDRRYQELGPLLPQCEALKQTLERVLPYWENHILPDLKTGKDTLIVAHGNSLRAIYKHLMNVADAEIPSLNIPTGSPMVLELDRNFKGTQAYYL